MIPILEHFEVNLFQDLQQSWSKPPFTSKDLVDINILRTYLSQTASSIKKPLLNQPTKAIFRHMLIEHDMTLGRETHKDHNFEWVSFSVAEPKKQKITKRYLYPILYDRMWSHPRYARDSWTSSVCNYQYLYRRGLSYWCQRPRKYAFVEDLKYHKVYLAKIKTKRESEYSWGWVDYYYPEVLVFKADTLENCEVTGEDYITTKEKTLYI